MSVRLLLGALALTLIAWLGAAGALVSSEQQATRERALLLRFVCESVAIRLEHDGPEADAFAARFGKIMRQTGASCSPKVPGLP